MNDSTKKKSTFDRFIRFFKTEFGTASTNDSNNSNSNISNILDEPICLSELEAASQESTKSENQEYMKVLNKSNNNMKQTEAFALKSINDFNDEYTIVENEWQNLQAKNIALSAVIYDEFIKELAAICQEHCVLTQD